MERSLGMVHDVGQLRAGDHVCWSYATDADHRSVLVDYLVAGLARGDQAVYYAPAGQADRLCGYLSDAGHDTEALLASGSLVLGSTEDAYLPDGTFEPTARIRSYAGLVERALAAGYAGLCVAADAAYVVTSAAAGKRWPVYELRADLLSTRLPMTALCCYDTRVLGTQALDALEAVHSATLRSTPRESHPLLRVHAAPDGSLVVAGELDLLSSLGLDTLLAECADDLAQPVIDVTGVDFADVAGMRALARGARALRQRRGDVRLAGASPTFRKVWGLLGYERIAAATLN